MLFQNSVSLRAICWLLPKLKIPIAHLCLINTHPSKVSNITFSGESVATYVAGLCSSEFGNFGGTLEVMICDRLVCGVNNGAINKWLLAQPKPLRVSGSYE
jgi:hypothetical protein